MYKNSYSSFYISEFIEYGKLFNKVYIYFLTSKGFIWECNKNKTHSEMWDSQEKCCWKFRSSGMLQQLVVPDIWKDRSVLKILDKYLMKMTTYFTESSLYT
jgi:hypothetical protein